MILDSIFYDGDTKTKFFSFLEIIFCIQQTCLSFYLSLLLQWHWFPSIQIIFKFVCYDKTEESTTASTFHARNKLSWYTPICVSLLSKLNVKAHHNLDPFLNINSLIFVQWKTRTFDDWWSDLFSKLSVPKIQLVERIWENDFCNVRLESSASNCITG